MKRLNYLINQIDLLKHNSEANHKQLHSITNQLLGTHISFLTATKRYGGLRVVGEVIRPIYDAINNTFLLEIKEADTSIRSVYDINYIRIFNIYNPKLICFESIDEYLWELEFYRKRLIGQPVSSPNNVSGQSESSPNNVSGQPLGLTDHIRKAFDEGHETNQALFKYLDEKNFDYKKDSVYRIANRLRKKFGMKPQSKMNNIEVK